MKKAFKIIGVIAVLLVIGLLAAPFIFKDSIEKIVKRTINENLNATVEWEELDLSLLKSFPDAALTISNFSVINKAPFAGDTLASGKTLKLDMGIKQLFKNESESIKVDALFLDESKVIIAIDSMGNANYDIAIKDDATLTDETENNAGFTFDLEQYEFKNSILIYNDFTTKTHLTVANLNHAGTGDFSLATSNLDTQTTAQVTFTMGDIEYLSANDIALDAVIQMDLDNQKYTFLENQATINQLPLTFDGFVKINETNNELNITFKTPSSDFKNFLAIIPKTYVKNLDGVTTTGNFTVNGMLKGVVDDDHIPTMDIKIRSDNASFKYADLPKAVRNISISADVINQTGLLKDTFINVGNLTFKIDDETFTAFGSFKDITENMLADLTVKGIIDLAKVDKIVPIALDSPLSGVFKADVSTTFDMNSVEKEQYQNIKTNGTASLTNFTYIDAAFKSPIQIATANIAMNPTAIMLDNLSASSGETDFTASGRIENLIPFLMSKQDLRGDFKVDSNVFNVNDFMTAETTTPAQGATGRGIAAKDVVKIPDFLDANLDFTAKNVMYDNIELTDVQGNASIKNETANLSNVSSDIFGGQIKLNGNVNTQNSTPTFAMDLDLSQIDITASFEKLELLQFLAPLAKSLQGKLNTKLDLAGTLGSDLTPNLQSLTGTALAQLLTADVNMENTPLLAKLDENLSFLDLNNLNIKDITTNLSFKDGGIQVAPFDFDIKGIKVTANGSHSLDKSIDYNLSLDVPARYLGGDINSLLSKLDPDDAANTKIVLPVTLTGSMNQPKIGVDTNAAVTALTQKLIQQQKDKLKDKGTNILQDLLPNLGGQSDSTSTTTKDTPPNDNQTETVIKDAVKDVIGGFFKPKKKDSTKNN